LRCRRARRRRIYDNPIGDEGMKILAEALMKHGKYIKQLQYAPRPRPAMADPAARRG